MRRLASLVAALCVALGLPPHAGAAENLIERPGAHTQYVVELEPHLSAGGYVGFVGGPGVRATFPIVSRGFIDNLNDSIGIGVGADVFFNADLCHSHGTVRKCHDTDFAIPVVMQWNFWFTREWSAFGEPGVMLSVAPHVVPRVNLAVGGRYQMNELMTLTLRLGFPTASFGVSFLL